MSNKHLLYLTDRQGNLEGVQLSAALWSHCEAAVVKALKAMEHQALGCFDDDIRYMIQAVDTLTNGLKKAKEE